MTPEEIGGGVVSGGWTYVMVSYAATWILLGGYAVSLWRRHLATTREEAQGGSP